MRPLNVIPTPLRERFDIVLQMSKHVKRLTDELTRAIAIRKTTLKNVITFQHDTIKKVSLQLQADIEQPEALYEDAKTMHFSFFQEKKQMGEERAETLQGICTPMQTVVLPGATVEISKTEPSLMIKKHKQPAQALQ